MRLRQGRRAAAAALKGWERSRGNVTDLPEKNACGYWPDYLRYGGMCAAICRWDCCNSEMCPSISAGASPIAATGASCG